ncbi:MAG: dimethylsulfonioproprionate lyase family protein [Gillisia sp.]
MDKIMTSKNKKGHAWFRLLAGFYSGFENISTGGNNTISQHRAKVLQRLQNYTHHVDLELVEPQQKPVCKYVTEAVKNGMETWYLPLLPAIGQMNKNLKWKYEYNYLPGNIKEKYAYAEVLGPRGPFVSKNLILGLLLLAPSAEYPKHRHTGIEESYLCLSGHVAFNDTGVFSTNTLIYVPPGLTHHLTTDNTEPCLLAYAWIADSKTLANATPEWVE